MPVEMPDDAPADTPPRSPCPVACTLDVIGDRWTLLVVRDLMAGKTQFKQFTASPEKIASNILAARLKLLIEAGLVEKTELPGRGGPVAYTLTPKGQSLRPVLKAVADWGLAHIPRTRLGVKLPAPTR